LQLRRGARGHHHHHRAERRRKIHHLQGHLRHAAHRQRQILLEGRNIIGETQARLLGLGVCYVPQGRNIFPELSGARQPRIGGIALGTAASLRPRIEQALDRFPFCAKRRAAQASTLSGGQQKLLEIARGLIAEPKLMLIDEPSIGLSPIMVKDVFATLQQLRDGGTSILMVEQKCPLRAGDFRLRHRAGNRSHKADRPGARCSQRPPRCPAVPGRGSRSQ